MGSGTKAPKRDGCCDRLLNVTPTAWCVGWVLYVLLLVVAFILVFTVHGTECTTDGQCSLWGNFTCVANSCVCPEYGSPHPWQCNPWNQWSTGVTWTWYLFWVTVMVGLVALCAQGVRLDDGKLEELQAEVTTLREDVKRWRTSQAV